MNPKAPSSKVTDWDQYYRHDPFLSQFTRPFVFGALVRTLQRYSVPHPVLVELGGAGGRVVDAVQRTIQPAAYHVVETNEYGLRLMRDKTGYGSVVLHLQDALHPAVDVIEHFDPEGTRRVIASHLELLKPCGIAVIAFPTPTLLYRLSRGISELAGKWIFHDERPLRTPEIRAAIQGAGTLLHERLIWQTPLTQTIVAIQKR